MILTKSLVVAHTYYSVLQCHLAKVSPGARAHRLGVADAGCRRGAWSPRSRCAKLNIEIYEEKKEKRRKREEKEIYVKEREGWKEKRMKKKT